MPKRITTCALTLLDKDDLGGITIGVNAKAAPGASIIEWSVDWDDEETEDNTIPLPSTAKHSYIEGGARLIILSVKDSKGKITSTGLNVLIVRNPTVSAPATPTGLTSSLISNNQIDLMWSDPATNETGFELQCQIDGGSFFNRIQLPPNTTSFSDTQIQASHTYTYRVRAFNAGGFSVFSNTTSQTTVINTYDYYVATNGNDTWNGLFPNPGSGSNGPFATVDHALVVATAALSGAGKVIGVRGNIPYNQKINNPSAAGTSWTNRIRVVNYNSEPVLITSTDGHAFGDTQKYIEVDGINLTSTAPGAVFYFGVNTGFIRYQNAEVINNSSSGLSGAILTGEHVTSGPHFLEFINLDVHGTGGPYGFYIQGDDTTITGCNIHETTSAGIHCYNNGGNPSNNMFYDNLIHDISVGYDDRRWGILISGTNNVAYNNVIYRITGPDPGHCSGIHFDSGANNCKYYFNTITACSGFAMSSYNANLNCVFRNTLSYNNIDNGYNIQGGGSVTLDHNFTSGTNPLFVNAAVDNYDLQAGSPALGFGVLVPGITTDFNGNSRPDPPSAGAYQ